MIAAPSIDHVEGVVVGSVEQTVDRLGRRRAIAITDPGVADEPRVRSVLAAWDTPPFVIPVGEPTFESVTATVSAVAAADPDVVVAIGGGSVLDTAKLAAALVASRGAVSDYVAGARSFSATLGVIAVPTTSGSGAEVSRTAVVSSHTTKTWAWDPLLRPGCVVVDPTLTTSMPGSVTVSTGLDAYVHAIEAATAARAGTSVTTHAAVAAAAIRRALPMALESPSDIEARGAMLGASVGAGWAIDRAGTGAGHAVGHALAALSPIPHGLAVAFGMSACLEWTVADDRARRAFERLGPIDDIRQLATDVDLDGLIGTLASQRIDHARLAEELGKSDHRPMRANAARPITDEDLATVSRLVADRWNALV